MKKYIFLLSFLVIGLTAQSQVLITLLLGDKLNSEGLEFGLEGGLNMANISGFEDNRTKSFFNLGFYFDIQIKNQWSLYTGVLVKSTLGAQDFQSDDLDFMDMEIFAAAEDLVENLPGFVDEEELTYTQRMNTFLLPFYIKYRFANNFYLKAGPQVGLRHKAWVEFESSSKNEGEILLKEHNKDDIQRIEAGFGGGFGYKFSKDKGMSIGIKYYYGLVDVYKEKSGTRNSSINFHVNIPIGANSNKDDTKG